MKVLFIGGNGNISWWCVAEALKRGYDVSVLNRQETILTRREVQQGVNLIKGDIRDEVSAKALLSQYHFDVVCDFLCCNEMHAQTAFSLFYNKVSQYVFISSESVYQREARYLPFNENTPLYNPDKISSEYIRGKILAEFAFRGFYEKNNFPVTVVRPSYTYDAIVPTSIGGNCFTAIKYALDINTAYIGGDGYSLRTFTHSSDFAKAFIWLIGNSNAVGQDYTIATDEWLTWNEATDIILNVFGVISPHIIHLEPDIVMRSFFGRQNELSWQKMWHLICDCKKIKTIAPNWTAEVPLREGIIKTKQFLEERKTHKRIDENLYKALSNMPNGIER